MKRILSLASLSLLTVASSSFAQEQTQVIERDSPNTANVTWDSVLGRSYFMQYSTDLQNWGYFPVLEYGDGTPQFSYGFSSTSDKIFVRLHYTDQAFTGNVNDADFDLDGVRNIDEVTTLGGTNPFDGDSDGDGKSDWQEFAEGFDPVDGISNDTTISLDVHSGSLVDLGQSLTNPNAADSYNISVSGVTSGEVSYQITDSSSSPTLNAQWIDISTTGEEIDFQGNNTRIVSKPLSFSFPLYESSYNQLSISYKGFLSGTVLGEFDGASPVSNTSLPNASNAGALICPMGIGYQIYTNSKVFFEEFAAVGQTPAYAIVQWQDVALFISDGNGGAIVSEHSFQAVIHEDGKIQFNYELIPSVGGGYVPNFLIGIQNEAKDKGSTAFYFDGNFNGIYVPPLSPITLEFNPTSSAGSADWLTVTPSDQVSGASLDWTYSIDTNGLNLGAQDSAQLKLSIIPAGSEVYEQIINLNVLNPSTNGNDTLTGTIGDDSNLNGLRGNDQITGHEGNDDLEGGDGDDTIDGGTGNDQLDGGFGNDTYVIRAADGLDSISETNFEENDRISFSDLFWEDLTITPDSATVLRIEANSATLLTVERQTSSVIYPSLRFSDGLDAIWDLATNQYRLQFNPDLNTYPDTNNNGVEDWLERLIFGSLQSSLDTSDNNSPTPNGIPDWWENHFFGGLNNSDGDYDDDGLTDLEEWNLGTDPTEVDTDGDGLSDKYEADSSVVNPLVADAQFDDADGDGLLFYQEQLVGTSDNNPDSDGDLSLDGAEYQEGTNPNNADSFPFDHTRYLGADLSGTGIPNVGQLDLLLTSTVSRHWIRGAYEFNTDLDEGALAPSLAYYELGRSVPFSEVVLRDTENPVFFELHLDGREIYRTRFNVEKPLDPNAHSEDAFFEPNRPALNTGSTSEFANSGSWLVLDGDNQPNVGNYFFGPERYFIPLETISWADNYTGNDVVGPMYRKIALNGRPMPDSQPQEEGESDSVAEQTYIDAFSLSLHHDTSFVYTPLGASDLVMEARASTQSTVWNNRGGLRPNETLTSPFGVSWSSNLCSYIEIVENRGQRSNAPQAVTVVDESGRPQRFGMDENGEYFPWPSSTVDKKTYLNTLEKVGDDFVFKKKFGSTLVYKPCDAWFMYSSDRTELSNSLRKHNYWRLHSVTDRYGVTMNYDYGSSNVALIPEAITCAQRPNQGIAIQRSSDFRRVDSITDSRGNTTHFDYTTYVFNIGSSPTDYLFTALEKVRFPDGSDVDYTYEFAPEEEIDNGKSTFYIHHNVKTITDKRGNTHTFNYAFDRTRKYFAGNGGKLAFAASVRKLPLDVRNDAEAWLDAQNRANWPGSSVDYKDIYGVPRRVTSVELPNGIGTSVFAKTSDTELTYGPEFTAVSKTEVTDAEGNKTCYDFTNVDGLVVNRSTTYSGSGSSHSIDWMIYYQGMEVHHGNWEGQTGYLGKEIFEYDPEAGMSLARMVDFSGNETTWEFANDYSDNVTTPFAASSTFFTKWADPTSKTDALGRVESYRYSDNFRIMDQKTDVYGSVTTHTIDSLGRSEGFTVVDKNNNKLREESYQYTEATLPAFKTKSTVEAFSNVSGQSWETDLVTQFVPNLTNGMVKDVIQDPDGFAYTSTTTYDNNNNKNTSTDGRGNTTTFSYDDLNRLTRVDYPVAGTSAGNAATYKEILYDYNGNKAAERDEEGNYVFYHRDALNRVTDTIVDMDGVGLPTTDANGLVPDTSRGSIGATDIVSSVTYNDVNSPVTSTDPRGIVTRTVYDAIQRPTDIYTDDLGSGTVAASSTKTHTELFYEDSLSINGVQYDANPGISAFSAGGFKPTRKVRNDAVLTDTGLASFTTYQVYDGLYRPLREVAQYDTNAGSFAANHRTTVTAYGAISGGQEALNRSVTDDRGKVTRSVMDGLGRTTSVTDGFGSTLPATSTTTYSSTGLAWKTIDPLNRESETEFDAVGRASKVWSPDPISGVVNKTLSANGLTGSPMTETQYDANSNVVKTINPLEFEWDFTFDSRNRKTDEYQPAVTDAANPASPVLNQRPHIQIAYNGVSKPISTTDARDNITRSFYDRAYRVTDVITNPVTGNPSTDSAALGANDILVETFYDKASNVLAVIDGNGNITRNGYDALNRLVATVVDPVDGDPVDPSNGSFNAATYQGSSANDDIVVTNAYDDAGNLTLVTDGEGHSTAFRYDGLARKTHTLWDVGTAVERVEYSAYDGLLLTAMTNPKLEATSYSYDDLHRLDDVTYIGRSADDRSMSYDLVGNLLSVSYPNETVANQAIRGCTQTYDKLNRVATETSNGVTHTNTYDRAGNLRTLTYGQTNRVITSVYDALNRLDNCSEAVGAATPRVTSYTYNLNGGVTRKVLPNSSYTDCVFDALNRKTSITNRLGSGTQIQRSVTEYDDQSNVTRLEEYTNSATADQITVMLNDRAYRLDTETRTEGAIVTLTDYGYDKGNNRTSKSVSVNGGAAQLSNYQFGTTSDGFNSNQLKSYNRPSTSDTVSFTYDENGNRLTRSVGADTDDYGYDYNNRLVSLDLETSSDASKDGLYEYQYDHRTRRVLRNESAAGSDATRVVFSGGLSVQEVDEAGGSYDLTSPSVEYVRGSDYGGGIGGVLYTLRGGNSSFNYYNHRGDVLLKTNDAGVITWEARYEAFGTRTHEIGSNLDRQKANTKDEDPTGLLNEGMRYRDLESGVFITRDPAGFVDGPNVYTYVRQNPWTMFDPLGLSAKGKAAQATWKQMQKWMGKTGLGKTVQAHHIIGREFFADPKVGKFFTDIGVGRDHYKNMILLPTKKGKAVLGNSAKRATHQGRHLSEYVTNVESNVRKIMDAHADGVISSATAKKMVHKMQAEFRSDLKQGKIALQKSDLEKMGNANAKVIGLGLLTIGVTDNLTADEKFVLERNQKFTDVQGQLDSLTQPLSGDEIFGDNAVGTAWDLVNPVETTKDGISMGIEVLKSTDPPSREDPPSFDYMESGP